MLSNMIPPGPGHESGVQFGITGSDPAYSEGLLFYDNHHGSLGFYNEEAGITLQIGQEQWIRVRNNSGVDIADGAAVYISGAISDNPTIELAKADNITTAHVIGIATHVIENNTVGYVTVAGLVHNLDTSSFSAGDTMYISSTVAGDLVDTAPTGDNYSVSVGTITRSHPTDGALLVHPDQILPLTAGTFAALASAPSYRQQAAASDEVTELAILVGAVTFRAETAFSLTSIRASLKTASTTGVVTVNVKKNGTTVFSTLLTIDQDEKTSVTAAVPAVLTTTPTAVADDDEITIDIDGAGVGAYGLKVLLLGNIT